MTRILTVQVDKNGVLTVPLEESDANKLVRVTVETLDEVAAPNLPTDQEAWLRFIQRIAGSITDPTFERQPQGDYEERDSM